VNAFIASFGASNCVAKEYVYDYRNQLIAYTEYEGSYSIKLAETLRALDSFNRRIITRTDDAGAADGTADGTWDEETLLLYDGQARWQLSEERDLLGTPDGDGNAPVAKTYVYGNYTDEVIQIRDHTQPAAENFYAHQDDLFSVYAITDGAGAVTQRYLYGDYGTRVTTDAAGTAGFEPALEVDHGFTGRLHDETSGLIEYRHRWMRAEMGRFVQRDPLWYVDGMNLYVLAALGPAHATDPLGLACRVSFECRYTGRRVSKPGDQVQCEYDCTIRKDIRRPKIDCFGGEVKCPDVPNDLVVEKERFVGIGEPCPQDFNTELIFRETMFDDCSRSDCRANCTTGEDIADFLCGRIKNKVAKILCKEAVEGGEWACEDLCNAFCKRR